MTAARARLAGRTARVLAPVLGLALLVGLPEAATGQETAEPPTEVVGPPTPPPAPPPAPTPAPTPVPPKRDKDKNDDKEPPPAQGPGATPTAPPPLTRTRRPTRTPRTTPTLTPVPFVTGALRLTLAAEPASSLTGPEVVLVIALANRALVPALGSTLEITLPHGLSLERMEAASGQTLQDGVVARWYVPRIEPEAETSLRLYGALEELNQSSIELCVLLLSAGEPLEHCSIFRLGGLSGGAEDRRPAPTAGLDFPTVAPPSGLLSDDRAPRLAGWGLFVLGLGVLGVWLGIQLRTGRPPGGS